MATVRDRESLASGTLADVLFDAFYSGAIGGSLVALFFLLVDAVNGHPLFTPSLLGSVMFEGVPAASVSEVDLRMVAYFTAVHLVAFGLLGLGVAFLVHLVELRSRHPLLVLLGAFLLFELAFFGGSALLMPGVVERIGVLAVAMANLLAAAGIAFFLAISHDSSRDPRADD